MEDTQVSINLIGGIDCRRNIKFKNMINNTGA